MHRYIQYGQEQVRTFDQNWLTKDAMLGVSQLTRDALGQTITVIGGFVASATSPATLGVSLTAGSVYQLAAADSTSFGSLPSDATQIMQQGVGPAQTVILTTAGIVAGQSQWALIEVTFSQVDAIRANDPTGGLLYYYNSSNPAQPFQGPGNDGLTQPTIRQALATINVTYGLAAATGSETPPTPTTGYVPMYLVDLTFGQTTIVGGQILQTGPSIGTGVPPNYPYAPFLAGLLNSHHGGVPGQAPKINLATEVQGNLPIVNAPLGSRTILLTPTTLWVNAATGSDSTGNGSSSQPWQTLQKAANVIWNTFDLNGQVVTVNCNGAFTTGIAISGLPVGASTFPQIIFNFATGSTINPINNLPCFFSGFGAAYQVQGPVTLTAPGAFGTIGGNIIHSNPGSSVYVKDVIFGAAGNAHMLGPVAVVNSYSIIGNAPVHIAAPNATLFYTVATTMTVTLSGTPTFSQGFAFAYQAGVILCFVSNVSFVGSGAIGPRYLIASNANIVTNGGGATFFPGNSPGIIQAPNQYT